MSTQNLPEGSIYSHHVNIVSYFDSEGTSKFMVTTGGDSQQSAYLGLLILAQNEILKWGTSEDNS